MAKKVGEFSSLNPFQHPPLHGACIVSEVIDIFVQGYAAGESSKTVQNTSRNSCKFVDFTVYLCIRSGTSDFLTLLVSVKIQGISVSLHKMVLNSEFIVRLPELKLTFSIKYVQCVNVFWSVKCQGILFFPMSGDPDNFLQITGLL